MSRVGRAPDTHAGTTPVRHGVQCFYCHRTWLDNKTRAIGRSLPSGHVWLDAFQQASATFIIYLRNVYQIRKQFFFVFSLPFLASEPNASIVARRRLRFPTQVGPCFFSHLLPVSFLLFLICYFLVFLVVVSLSLLWIQQYRYDRLYLLKAGRAVWQDLFFYFSRCRVIAFWKVTNHSTSLKGFLFIFLAVVLLSILPFLFIVLGSRYYTWRATFSD